MAIDAYALCPGGTGKKIKFCCPDLFAELEKIDRMLEGEQILAATGHVDHLLAKSGKRACLMAIKGMLLRSAQQMEAAQAHAAEFLEAFPENPIAWAESAVLTAVTEGGRPSMPKLQRALACSDRNLGPRVYMAMDVVAEALLEDDDWLAARALWRLQLAAASDDQRPMQHLVELNHSPHIPLLLKDEPPLAWCPEGVAGKSCIDEALGLVPAGRWQAAAQRLAALTQGRAPDGGGLEGPGDCPRLAGRRRWGCPGLAEVRRAPRCQDMEDAVEATAIAMMLSHDPLGDATDWLHLDWPVEDAERLQESLLSDPRINPVPFDPAAMASDQSPPPRGISCSWIGPRPRRPRDRAGDDTADAGAGDALRPADRSPGPLGGRRTFRPRRRAGQGIARPAGGRCPRTGATATGLRPDLGEPAITGRTLESAAGHNPHTIGRFDGPASSAGHPGTLAGNAAGSARRADTRSGRRRPGPARHPLGRRAGAGTLVGPGRRRSRPQRTPQPPGPAHARAPGIGAGQNQVLVRGADGTRRGRKTLRRGFRGGIPTSDGLPRNPGNQEVRPRDCRPPQFRRSARTPAGPQDTGRNGRKRGGSPGAHQPGPPDHHRGREVLQPWDLIELSFRFAAAQAQEAMQLVHHIETKHMEEKGIAQALTIC